MMTLGCFKKFEIRGGDGSNHTLFELLPRNLKILRLSPLNVKHALILLPQIPKRRLDKSNFGEPNENIKMP